MGKGVKEGLLSSEERHAAQASAAGLVSPHSVEPDSVQPAAHRPSAPQPSDAQLPIQEEHGHRLTSEDVESGSFGAKQGVESHGDGGAEEPRVQRSEDDIAENPGFWEVVGLFLWVPKRNILFFSAMAILCCAQVLVMTFTAGPIIGDFFSSLISRDLEAFWSNVLKAIWSYTLTVLMDSSAKYLSEVLAMRWRKQLSTTLHEQYLKPSERLFYWINAEGAVDNPDQRIASDAKLLCDSMAKVVLQIISAPLYIVMGGALTVWLVGIGGLGVCVFFLAGYVLQQYLTQAVITRVAKHQALEGNLRTSHIWVRKQAAEVGVMKGSTTAKKILDSELDEALNLQLQIAYRHWWLNVVSDTWMYLAAVINYLVIAAAVFLPGSVFTWGSHQSLISDNDATFAANVSKASYYSLMLCQGFSLVVKVFVDIVDMNGYAVRISELVGELRRSRSRQAELMEGQAPKSKGTEQDSGSNEPAAHDRHLSPSGPSGACSWKEEGDQIHIQDVTLSTPQGQLLVHSLNLVVGQGDRILITGCSGSGKSTLVKTLGGLWRHFSGAVAVPAQPTFMILPQEPVIVPGTLLDQVVFPSNSNLSFGGQPWGPGGSEGCSDSLVGINQSQLRVMPRGPEIEELFEVLELGHLLHRFDLHKSHQPWGSVLSQGEQQRLAFARLFFHKPSFVVLDEATSALPEETECKLYSHCIHSGMSLLSIGHRKTLRNFHKTRVHLDGRGSWERTDF